MLFSFKKLSGTEEDKVDEKGKLILILAAIIGLLVLVLAIFIYFFCKSSSK